MTRTSFIIGLLAVSLLSGNVWANAQQTCDQKKQAVKDLENKWKDNENKIKDIDNKVEALQKELKTLAAEKAQKKSEGDKIKREIAGAKREEAQACANVAKCEDYKKKLDEYKKEFDETRAEIAKLHGTIKTKLAAVAVLEKKVDGYEASYEKLGCDSLVAGETDQSTIDQCNKIFSDWNADQKSINDLNAEVGKLSGESKKLSAKAKGIRGRIAKLRVLIKKDCQGTPMIKESEDLEKQDDGADAVDKDIESMKTKLKKIKKVRIIQPKLGKAKKGRSTEKAEAKDNDQTEKKAVPKLVRPKKVEKK